MLDNNDSQEPNILDGNLEVPENNDDQINSFAEVGSVDFFGFLNSYRSTSANINKLPETFAEIVFREVAEKLMQSVALESISAKHRNKSLLRPVSKEIYLPIFYETR